MNSRGVAVPAVLLAEDYLSERALEECGIAAVPNSGCGFSVDAEASGLPLSSVLNLEAKPYLSLLIYYFLFEHSSKLGAFVTHHTKLEYIQSVKGSLGWVGSSIAHIKLILC